MTLWPKAFSNPMYGIAELSRMARPSIVGLSRTFPKEHTRERVRRQRYTDCLLCRFQTKR
jgi:hypothetical protein